MVLHKRRHGADLHHVRVVGRVLEQAVVRVEHLLRQQEEEFPRRAAVVQTVESMSAVRECVSYISLSLSLSVSSDSPFLSYKGDVELVSLELFARVGHHLIKGAFQQVFPSDDEP